MTSNVDIDTSRRSPFRQTSIINSNVAKTEYAVRGELYLAATKRKEEGKEVILTNVGNPQALGQRPITFFRQVLACLVAPFLEEDPAFRAKMPKDVLQRAASYRKMLSGGSIGAYTDSRGVPGIREEVAEFIRRRDSVPVKAEDVFITNGASAAVCRVFSTLLRDQSDVVLVPIPQYPLYSASVVLHGGTMVGYGLTEETGWQTDIKSLQAAVEGAREAGQTVRAMVIINPGNPTGQCASREMLRACVKFCADNNIILLADEVYQTNIYQTDNLFYSMLRTAHDLGEDVVNRVEIISFHSASKGALGECGMRGGYLHMHGCTEVFKRELYKLFSVSLSPNVVGNVAVGLMCNPPRPGQPSYKLYRSEIDSIIESLKRRARLITDTFNSCEGISCQNTEGAMYSFPQITLPPAAVAAAAAAKKVPDVFYCLALLGETGISVVPGSGFGQEEGTFHFRTTILPAEEDLGRILALFKKFHAGFMDKYRGRSKL